MRALVDWVNRLRAVESGDELVGHMLRVLAPGTTALEIDNCLIALGGFGRSPLRPGDSTPSCVSIARIVDKAGPQLPVDEQRDRASAIGALLSFVLDRRVEVVHELEMTVQGSPSTLFVGYGASIDRRMFGPVDGDPCSPLTKALAQLVSLERDKLDPIGAALDLHYGAALLFEKDVSAAYTLLVAGIETLSRHFGEPPSDWGQWEDSTRWEAFSTRHGLTDEQRQALSAELMRDKELRLSATFVDYATTRVGDTFWSRPWIDWMYPVNATTGQFMDAQRQDEKTIGDVLPRDPRLLRSALKKTYSARSSFVHRGDRLTFLRATVRQQTLVEDAQPLPFPVLRSLLTELIRLELDEHATTTSLPDIAIVKPGPS